MKDLLEALFEISKVIAMLIATAVCLVSIGMFVARLFGHVFT